MKTIGWVLTIVSGIFLVGGIMAIVRVSMLGIPYGFSSLQTISSWGIILVSLGGGIYLTRKKKVQE